MYRHSVFSIVVAFTVLISTSLLHAAPSMTHYQGRLTDNTGSPVASGTYALSFALYNISMSGTPLWTEAHSSVLISGDGLFSVMLGSLNPFPDSVFSNSELYLEIAVNSEIISPRSQIGGAPFAMAVGTLHGATGGMVNGSLIIKPSNFDSLGNGIIVLDSNDNASMTISIGSGGLSQIDFYDPVDSKSGATSHKKISLRKEGLVMYGASESDTTMMLSPDGNIESTGQITLGQNSASSGVWSTVFGFNNSATADSATISGGYNNLANGFNAVIGGGSFNQAGLTSTVSGGVVNIATAQASTIGGGNINTNNGEVSVIAGGGQNTIDGGWSTIGGGAANSIGLNALYSTISGGYFNNSDDTSSTIIGGSLHLANQPYATVLGGLRNQSTARFSYSAGRRAVSTHAGSFVWSDSSATDFFSTKPNEFAINAENGLRVNSNNASYGGQIANNGDGDGLRVFTNSTQGNSWGALYAQSNSTAAAVSASAIGGGLAGYFNGNVQITGSISKGSGSFKIDHPLDPENKYLYHSFVESPDMKNIYDGNVTTDANGYAVVTLPEYFSSLNSDFRYQLTVIGSFTQAIIAEEIAGNSFTIRTEDPNVKVSWMVTGIRKDPFAEQNRIEVEVDKKFEDRGKYLHPEAYGYSKDKAIDNIDDKLVIDYDQ